MLVCWACLLNRNLRYGSRVRFPLSPLLGFFMIKCEICNSTFPNKGLYANHFRWTHSPERTCVCGLCGKVIKDKSGYPSHVRYCKGVLKKKGWCCPKCGIDIKTCWEKHFNSCDGSGPRRLKKRREGGQAWLKGHCYEEIFGKKRAEEIKRLQGLNHTDFHRTWKSWSEERKNRFRDNARKNILRRYREGWAPKAGRCRKIVYHSKIAGKVLLDGSWELSVAKFLDSLGVCWVRNKKRFRYTNLEGEISHYTPDFFVKSWRSYLEVKGYETSLDRCKWRQFKSRLLVWKKREMKIIKEIMLGSPSW